MSELEAPRRYKYTFSRNANFHDSESGIGSRKEMQDFVNATLGLMTGGCEICVYSNRLYCEKCKKLVRAGQARCEFFVRRPAAEPRG